MCVVTSRTRSRGRRRSPGAALAAALALAPWDDLVAATFLDGFREEVVVQGLSFPTAVDFASDGRIFVAEKRGRILVFDGPGDDSPELLADLSVEVLDYWDRGMLGLAVDPAFPQRPFVYALYTLDADPLDPEAAVPLWNDACPTPPGATIDGCAANGRLVKLEVGPGNSLVGRTVLLEHRWCGQYPGHGVDDLAFDDQGRLYVSAGDGAKFNGVDYGQGGGSADSPTPPNPCDDPPGGRGTALEPPAAEGGALRSQDLRTPGDGVSFDGTVLRIDPDTGQAADGNPLLGGDPADDAIVAYGLRNPFRIAVHAGTRELWIGDVGWGSWEEINRVPVPEARATNLGWPCYEGPDRQGGYDALDLTLCESLYADLLDPAQGPWFAYRHGARAESGTSPLACAEYGSGSISGLAFNTGEAYPTAYRGALFFQDYTRSCLFAMRADPNGLPDPSRVETIADGLQAPVHLKAGPGGHLYWVDLFGGRVLRLGYFRENTPPTAAVSATPTHGTLPLHVQFDASASSDPDPDAVLSYAWDLDGDGEHDDSTAAIADYEYATAGVVEAEVRVTDERGATDLARATITAGNRPPAVTLLEPSAGTTWRVGQTIALRASALDPEDGAVPGSALDWTIDLLHCTENGIACHVHPVSQVAGQSETSFVAPDHDEHARLRVRVTARDAGLGPGAGGILASTSEVLLEPEIVELAFESEPAGLTLAVGATHGTTPFRRAVVEGSTVSIGAASPHPAPEGSYLFLYWSDGGAAAHDVVAHAGAAAFRATFVFRCETSNCTPVLRVGPDPLVAPHETIGEAVAAASRPGTRIEILPGGSPYMESVELPTTLGLVLSRLDDGTGRPVVVHGGALPAIDVVDRPGEERTTEIRDLVLSGGAGIRAAAPTRLRRLTFRDVMGTAIDLLAAAHDASGIEIGASVATGLAVSPSAELRLERTRIEGVAGDGMRIAGNATIVNALLARGAEDGVEVASTGRLRLAHSTVASNLGAGIDASSGAAVEVRDSILWSNAADLLGVSCSELAHTLVGDLDCSASGANLFGDPRLGPDDRLLPDSPAIDSAPATSAEACTDLAGAVRGRDFDGDGIAQVDLGAYEQANPVRPAEVTGLRFTDATTLNWDPAPGAVAYRVRRGELATVDENAAACRNLHAPDPSDTEAQDVEVPPAGAGFFYLVSALDGAANEGAIGFATCAERVAGTCDGAGGAGQ